MFEEFLRKSEELFQSLDPGREIILHFCGNFYCFCWKLAENTGTVQISSLVDVLNLFHSSTAGTMTVKLSGQFLAMLCCWACVYCSAHSLAPTQGPRKKYPAKQNDSNNSKSITLKARTCTHAHPHTFTPTHTQAHAALASCR